MSRQIIAVTMALMVLINIGITLRGSSFQHNIQPQSGVTAPRVTFRHGAFFPQGQLPAGSVSAPQVSFMPGMFAPQGQLPQKSFVPRVDVHSDFFRLFR